MNKQQKMIYLGSVVSDDKLVKVQLFLIKFVDENGVHIVYSPHLDLAGYGENEKEAQESFNIHLNEFIDYTIKKKTMVEVLKKLGWKLKRKPESIKEAYIPPINIVLSKKKIIDIFKEYQTKTYHEEIALPIIE